MFQTVQYGQVGGGQSQTWMPQTIVVQTGGQWGHMPGCPRLLWYRQLGSGVTYLDAPDSCGVDRCVVGSKTWMLQTLVVQTDGQQLVTYLDVPDSCGVNRQATATDGSQTLMFQIVVVQTDRQWDHRPRCSRLLWCKQMGSSWSQTWMLQTVAVQIDRQWVIDLEALLLRCRLDGQWVVRTGCSRLCGLDRWATATDVSQTLMFQIVVVQTDAQKGHRPGCSRLLWCKQMDSSWSQTWILQTLMLQTGGWLVITNLDAPDLASTSMLLFVSSTYCMPR